MTNITVHLSTNIIDEIVNVGTYYSFMSDWGVYDENGDIDTEWRDLWIHDITLSAGLIFSKVVKNYLHDYNAHLYHFDFCSPRYYNFEDDWLECDMDCDSTIIEGIQDYCNNNPHFYTYIHAKWKSRDGFISNMPYEKEKYLSALLGDNTLLRDKAISMYINYIAYHDDHYPISQTEFEDAMYDSDAYELVLDYRNSDDN